MTTKELLALVGKATPGPWSVYTPEHSPSLPGIDAGDETIVVWGDAAGDDGGVRGPANAALIVAAVNALPALCAEVEALRKDAERYRWLLTHAVTMSFDSEGSLETGEWHSIADNVGDEDRTLDMVIDAAKEPK